MRKPQTGKAAQRHCAQQDDAPPGWVGSPPPRTLAELADYLDGKLRVFRELPDRTKGDFEECVERSGLISIRNRRAKPEYVRRRLQYALFASRNVIRWLDQRRMTAGRPAGVADGDGIERVEDKLSALLQWTREMPDDPQGETAPPEIQRASQVVRRQQVPPHGGPTEDRHTEEEDAQEEGDVQEEGVPNRADQINGQIYNQFNRTAFAGARVIRDAD